MQIIKIEPLTRAAFAPFGDVIEFSGEAESFEINNGTTTRFHDLATITATGQHARATISLARAMPFDLPLKLTMMERHPLGSQAFIPIKPARFLVLVALDHGSKPHQPKAFLTAPGQGINFTQNTWHGVLTALDQQTDFLIVDRVGDGDNLEIFEFPDPFMVQI